MARVGGRQKGVENKINSDIRKMVIHALHYAGGVDYLVTQAHKNPVAFLGLVGRVLPLQVTGADGGKLRVEFSWADAPTPLAQPTIEAAPIVVNAETVEDESEVIITFEGDELKQQS